MCNGTLMTYWELLQNYDIVIPCFQRDYAQGRDDAQASDVRESLIRSVISVCPLNHRLSQIRQSA